MTDFELITSPIKQFKIKMQLILGNNDSSFPSLRKYILWDERSGEVWGKFYSEGMTWKEFGQRELGDVEATVVQEMDGDVLALSQSIDRNSDIRRTISVSIHLDDPSYFESVFSAIWLNRLIRIQFGLFNPSISEYRWFGLGDYMVTSNDYFYDAQTNQLNLSLADLMASTTEHRGNQIGTEIKYPMGTPLKDALEGTVSTFFPFTHYEIDDFNSETIPYDLEFTRGIYPYEIAKKIIGLFPGYEHYYSPEGAYKAQPIPMGVDEEVKLTAEQMKEILISENGHSSPQDIRNVTEVWGKELDAENTALSCVTNNSREYYIRISDPFVLEDGFVFSFTPDVDSTLGQRIKIQDTPSYSLINENGGSVSSGELKAGIHYVVKYTNGNYILLGQSNIHAICFLYTERPDPETVAVLKSRYNCNDITIMVDRNSRFTIDWIGQRVQVLSGGEFEDIYTTKLALERASYETWKKARAQETLQLETLYVPWLDVNQKVAYKSIVSGEENEYIVDSIQVNIESFSMTLTMSHYYPYYPWLRKSTVWGDYAGVQWSSLADLYWDEMAYPAEEA